MDILRDENFWTGIIIGVIVGVIVGVFLAWIKSTYFINYSIDTSNLL